MRKRLQFEFGTVDVYDHYLLAVMKEGITIKPKHNDTLVHIANEYFNDRRFGYITFRKNSYAVNPQVYKETSKIKNLAAFAIVANSEVSFKNAALEKTFFKKPLEVFNSLDAAKVWISQCIDELS